MQLQCNTKEFRQLEFGKIYECTDVWTQEIRKNKYEMIEVEGRRYMKDNFKEIDEQTKDLIQDNPVEELTADDLDF